MKQGDHVLHWDFQGGNDLAPRKDFNVVGDEVMLKHLVK